MNQTTENQAVGQDPAVEFGRILRLGREEKSFVYRRGSRTFKALGKAD